MDVTADTTTSQSSKTASKAASKAASELKEKQKPKPIDPKAKIKPVTLNRIDLLCIIPKSVYKHHSRPVPITEKDDRVSQQMTLLLSLLEPTLGEAFHYKGEVHERTMGDDSADSEILFNIEDPFYYVAHMLLQLRLVRKKEYRLSLKLPADYDEQKHPIPEDPNPLNVIVAFDSALEALMKDYHSTTATTPTTPSSSKESMIDESMDAKEFTLPMNANVPSLRVGYSENLYGLVKSKVPITVIYLPQPHELMVDAPSQHQLWGSLEMLHRDTGAAFIPTLESFRAVETKDTVYQRLMTAASKESTEAASRDSTEASRVEALKHLSPLPTLWIPVDESSGITLRVEKVKQSIIDYIDHGDRANTKKWVLKGEKQNIFTS